MSHACHRFWKCYRTFFFLLTFDTVHNPLRLPRETTSERPKMVRTCCVLTFWLGHVLRATTACTFSTSQLPKAVRECCVFHILTWTCASRHNSVHLLDISTSKSGPRMLCFSHFDLEMCFAPQRRALFGHLNFQKCSEPGVTWKCASGHDGVQLFISHLPTWLRTRRFSKPTFRPSGATNRWKNKVSRNFTFSRAWIFFLLTLSSVSFFWPFLLSFSSLLFSSLLSSPLLSSSLLFPALPCSSLLFPALPCSSLLFPALPCSSLLFPALPCSSLPFSSLLFSALLFSSLLWLLTPLLFHLSILSEVWLLNFLRLMFIPPNMA